MIYVTSDLHGYPLREFKKLLDSSGFDRRRDFLFVLGDVIDRGKEGVLILKWLMQNESAELILGNHEIMMLRSEFVFRELTEDSLSSMNEGDLARLAEWKSNGADPTLRALAKETPEVRRDIIEFLSECPLYEDVTVGGRRFVLTHAGLGNYEEGKELDSYSEHDLTWARPRLEDEYSGEFITVFGHTPTIAYGSEFRGRAIKTKTYINVDTGASAGLAPMMLRLDDLKEFYLT